MAEVFVVVVTYINLVCETMCGIVDVLLMVHVSSCLLLGWATLIFSSVQHCVLAGAEVSLCQLIQRIPAGVEAPAVRNLGACPIGVQIGSMGPL